MSESADHVLQATAAEPQREGISLERRRMLWLPVAAVAGAWIHGPPIFARNRQEAIATAAETSLLSPLTLDRFGEHWAKLADALKLGSLDDDESYAAQLAGALARVPLAALPRLEGGRGRRGFVAGPSWFVAECVTIEFRMEPEAELPFHNHPPQVVVTLCAEGEVGYAHYEIEGEAPPCTQIDGKEFRVRETRSGFLTRNRSTSLTRARDGIHGFRAGKHGARIIDFTISLTEDIETFSYVERSAKPVDEARRIYSAVWSGKEAK